MNLELGYDGHCWQEEEEEAVVAVAVLSQAAGVVGVGSSLR